MRAVGLMPTQRKYHGPCPEHSKKRSGCLHCGAYYMQRRYHGSEIPPEDQRRQVAPQREVEIYRGLHWPAPGGVDG